MMNIMMMMSCSTRFGGDKPVPARQLRREEADLEEDTELTRLGYTIRDWNALCRGEKVRRTAGSSDKICVLTSNNHPYHLLAPFKLEIVSRYPVLFMYHDVLSKREIQMMKTGAGSQLVTSAMQDTLVTAGSKVTNERTQSNAWLWDHLQPALHSLSLRTERMSGLRHGCIFFQEISKPFFGF